MKALPSILETLGRHKFEELLDRKEITEVTPEELTTLCDPGKNYSEEQLKSLSLLDGLNKNSLQVLAEINTALKRAVPGVLNSLRVGADNYRAEDIFIDSFTIYNMQTSQEEEIKLIAQEGTIYSVCTHREDSVVINLTDYLTHFPDDQADFTNLDLMGCSLRGLKLNSRDLTGLVAGTVSVEFF